MDKLNSLIGTIVYFIATVDGTPKIIQGKIVDVFQMDDGTLADQLLRVIPTINPTINYSHENEYLDVPNYMHVGFLAAYVSVEALLYNLRENFDTELDQLINTQAAA